MYNELKQKLANLSCKKCCCKLSFRQPFFAATVSSLTHSLIVCVDDFRCYSLSLGYTRDGHASVAMNGPVMPALEKYSLLCHETCRMACNVETHHLLFSQTPESHNYDRQ